MLFPLEDSKETVKNRSQIHEAVLFTLTFVGIVSNTLLILVWRRQVYHPTRLNLMTLAFVNILFLIAYPLFVSALKSGSNLPNPEPVYILASFFLFTTRTYGVQCCTWMSIVHNCWTCFPLERSTSVFFTKKRIVLCLVVLFLWCLMQVILKLVLLTKVSKADEDSFRFSVEAVSLGLPVILQVAIVREMIKSLRIKCKVKVLEMPYQGRRGAVCHQLHDDSRTAIADPDNLSTALWNPPSIRLEKSALRAFKNEQRLTKTVVVITVVPVFVYPFGIVVGALFSVLFVSKTDKEIYETYTLVLEFVNSSYQFFLFVAALPTFRRLLKVECNRWCCGYIVPFSGEDLQETVTSTLTSSSNTTFVSGTPDRSATTSTSTSQRNCNDRSASLTNYPKSTADSKCKCICRQDERRGR